MFRVWETPAKDNFRGWALFLMFGIPGRGLVRGLEGVSGFVRVAEGGQAGAQRCREVARGVTRPHSCGTASVQDGNGRRVFSNPHHLHSPPPPPEGGRGSTAPKVHGCGQAGFGSSCMVPWGRWGGGGGVVWRPFLARAGGAVHWGGRGYGFLH